VLVDFLIKRWVDFSVKEPILVWKNFLGIDFYIHYVTNRGGAFGMLQAFFKPLLIFRIFVVIALLVYLIKNDHTFKKSLCIVFVLAGAIGNVIDSFLYGHVIDMFHFLFWGRSYGIFNFADAMIFVGSLGLFITSKKIEHGSVTKEN
jgi:signal peptidase II